MDGQIDGQTDGRTIRRMDRQTTLKQYTPDLSIQGHKNMKMLVSKIFFSNNVFKSVVLPACHNMQSLDEGSIFGTTWTIPGIGKPATTGDIALILSQTTNCRLVQNERLCR